MYRVMRSKAKKCKAVTAVLLKIEIPYFSIDNAHLMYNAHPKLMYTAVYRACSFFTNLDLFCIDNARVIYRKIRYTSMSGGVDCAGSY